MARAIEIETPHGPARAYRDDVKKPKGTLLLGHGAGGSVDAPDLGTAAAEANRLKIRTILVEQPYKVAGRKTAAPTHQLDAAWLAVVADLRERGLIDAPLISGGRSSGARVACRTADEAGADAVLCLAFPVHPPGKPEKTRIDELDAVTVPVLVVQGESDPFGMPEPAKGREVAQVAGNHGLKKDLDAVAEAISAWLPTIAK